MLQFYGSPMSSAGRTHWMLEEVGVPYEYHRVNTREGGTRSPEYLALNPGGKVPFVVDGDVRLSESMAINFYLAERYRPELMPTDLVTRATVYRWSLWAISNLQPELMTVMLHSALLPEERRLPALVAEARARSGPLLDEIETCLAKEQYLAAGRFTVADVNAGSVVNIANALGMLGERAGVKAWMARLKARPAYQKAAADG